MIESLDISGLGVIETATLALDPRPGFTAITGETGAGKTMVLTALELLLGGRASASMVRRGARSATVEGRFVIDADGPLGELVAEVGGIAEPVAEAPSPVELIVRREVSAAGRSRAWLGSAGVPAAKLAEAGEFLVAIHGQSDQLRLVRESAQRAALDAFGGEDAAVALDEVATGFARLASLRSELATLEQGATERAAEREQLRELVDAVEQLDPAEDEDAQLLARIERLSNREELRGRISEAHQLLSGDDFASAGAGPGAIRDLVKEVHQRIDRAHRTDASLDAALEAAVDLQYAADDLAQQLSGYLAELDTDGVGELDPLNERLAAIEELKRQQQATLAEVLEAYRAAGIRLLELSGDDARIPSLRAETETAEAELEAAASRLTTLRQASATRLASEVTAELAALAMPNARLVVEVDDSGPIRSHGRDRVTLLLEPHPGSSPLPIAQGASGGELSRVMLALEVVLAAANPVPTLVFDEIDAGVGGAAALEIGARLQRLAERSQVIVVTHLAQVAAYADHHVTIEKESSGEVTTSSIRTLDEDGRVAEMTRLLSGLPDSESGREHAQELLRRAAETAPRANGTASASGTA